MGQLRRLALDRAGGVLVETALVTPLLFAVLFGSVEAARMIWTQLALNYAVEEGARCASITPTVCSNAAQTLAFAQARAAPLTLPAGAMTVTTAACGVQVSASLAYQPTVGGIVFKTAPTLKAQVCKPL